MNRYIDADELHKQGWVAARYINWEPTPLNDNFRLEVEVKPFTTFYAADVQEVVRCGECVNWNEDFQYNTCALFGGRWNENMFCWYGERKDG